MNFFNIQDLTFSDSYSLHEALLSCSDGAKAGGAAFAFVTKKALEVVLSEQVFQKLFKDGDFTFLAGVDEITNEETLKYLKNINNQHSGFKPHSFVHSNSGSLFHPKFCWFEKESGGVLIVGSGNFTMKGLRRNREAFAVIELDESGMSEVKEYWNKWLENNNESLLDVLSDKSLEKAKQNKVLFKKAKKLVRPTIKESEEAQNEDYVEASDWTFSLDSEVLVAEIPKSGDRWKQVNFTKDIFQNYFGATPGDNSQRILFRNVDSKYVLGEVENRLSVSVKSQNYRFELSAAEGLDYPQEGPPIGIFIKLATRTFLYNILMPSASSYDCFSEWLNTNWDGRADRMKRIITKVKDIKNCIDQTSLSGYFE